MKTSWMLSFLIPSFIFTSYPIYDDDASSEQPELVTRESHLPQQAIKEKRNEKTPCYNSEEKASKKSKQDQKTVKSAEKSASSIAENKESSISKRELIKRNSTVQSHFSRSKLRRNPNRPRVIQRNEQKQLQDLSKIEADAEEIENGASTQQQKKENQDESSSESVTVKEADEN
jgi:hypothetical protein